MKNANKFLPKSLFNENLQVTKELAAVTYGKRSYNSLRIATPQRRGESLIAAEHAFILIQTHKMFYRAEIGCRDLPLIETIVNGEKVLTPPNPAFDYIIRDTEEAFYNERTFNQALPEILDKQKLTDIVNHTWLVPIDKVEELMADILADMGSVDLGQKNAIPYFGLGNESLRYPGKKQDCINEAIRTLAIVGSMAGAMLQLKTFFKDASAHKELKASATHLCENSGCVLEGATKAMALVTAALSPLWTRAIIDSTIEPKKQFPKVYSCATWAAEKLHNLGIAEIDNDLRPSILLSLIDKIGYMTTLHVGDLQEIREAGVRNWPHKQPIIDSTVQIVGRVQGDLDALKTSDDCIAPRIALKVSGVVISAIVADIAKEAVVKNCFDR